MSLSTSFDVGLPTIGIQDCMGLAMDSPSLKMRKPSDERVLLSQLLCGA